MPTINKNNSFYSASFTGCSFMLYELNRVLPLMQSDNSEELLLKEVEDNQYIMVDNRKSRQIYIREFGIRKVL